MPEATYRYPGDEIHVASAAAAQNAGDVVQVGGLAGVVEGLSNIEVGDPMNVRVKGVFEVASASATVFAEGATVNWDDTAKLAITAAGDWTLGKAAKAKANGETVVSVILNE